MATPHEFQLGLLPERKLSWRTLITSYGLEIILVLLLLNIGLIWPQRIPLPKYRFTELIARPDPEPYEAPPPKPVQLTKLLPPAPIPAPLTAPKLSVPPEVRHTPTQPAPEPEAPKV